MYSPVHLNALCISDAEFIRRRGETVPCNFTHHERSQVPPGRRTMKISPQIAQIFIRIDPPNPRSIFSTVNMNGYTQ
jgi:hypothetical protein